MREYKDQMRKLKSLAPAKYEAEMTRIQDQSKVLNVPHPDDARLLRYLESRKTTPQT